jgi:hypothetical protein
VKNSNLPVDPLVDPSSSITTMIRASMSVASFAQIGDQVAQMTHLNANEPKRESSPGKGCRKVSARTRKSVCGEFSAYAKLV